MGTGGAEDFRICLDPKERVRTRADGETGGDETGEIGDRFGDSSDKKVMFLRCNLLKRSISCIIICNCNPRFEKWSSEKRREISG